MFIDIDFNDPRPAYQQLVEVVTNAIATGALEPGDRLPAIRAAAVQARVNRNTISRAYLELEHQGLVTARHGAGYFVSLAGTSNERRTRRARVEALIGELAQEAALAGVSTRELKRMIEARCASGVRSEGARM